MLFTHKNRKSCYLMSAPFSVLRIWLLCSVFFFEPEGRASKRKPIEEWPNTKQKAQKPSKSATCAFLSRSARVSLLSLVCSQFGYNSLPSEYISQAPSSSSSSKEDHIETQLPPARAYTKENTHTHARYI